MLSLVAVLGAFGAIFYLIFRRFPSFSLRRAFFGKESLSGENAAAIFAVVECAVLVLDASRHPWSLHWHIRSQALIIAGVALVLVALVATQRWGALLLTVIGVVVAVYNESRADGRNAVILVALILLLLWILGLVRGFSGGGSG